MYAHGAQKTSLPLRQESRHPKGDLISEILLGKQNYSEDNTHLDRG